MLDHFLSVGGNEILNSARAYGYATTADCRASWVRDPECSTIAQALGEMGDYTHEQIELAPWYDPDDPDASARFLGAYAIEVRGLSDSTRSAAVVERTLDGGKVTGYRQASREVRVRAWLTGAGEDALELGMTWLRNALEPDACGVHGGACGEADATFFVSCPPAREQDEEEEDYLARVAPYRRFLHSVRCISGPFVVSERLSSDGVHVGRLVEFTLLAENPWVHGMPKEIELPPIVPTVVQDVAYNLAPYPSMELAGVGEILAATNFCDNPSVETNATGYSTVIQPSSTPDPASIVTSGRSNDIAADGAWSYRVRLDASTYADEWAGIANLSVHTPSVDVTDLPAGARPSFTTWAAAVLVSGYGGFLGMNAYAVFDDVADTEIELTTDNVEYDGTVFAAKSVEIPAGATTMHVRVDFLVQWYSEDVGAGFVPTDARMYVDAVAVTVP